VSGRRLLVIGAGPIGIAAALGGVRRGCTVSVIEAEEVGASLRHWGATRFFSPLGMNLPPGAREFIEGLPPDNAILTGPEFVDSVLLPLAQSDPLKQRISTGHRVVAVGRAGLTRCDMPGHPLRAERPFRLLVEGADGEKVLEADYVIDASGTYGQPVALGQGGIPARGERALAGALIRDLGSLHARLEELRGKRILLVGHGHSAANAIAVLASVADRSPETGVVWATRSMNQRPCVAVFPDPLPERERIVTQANQLAASPPAWLKMERRASVEDISRDGGGCLRVSLTGGRNVAVDEIVALTGYRPDLTFLSELAIEISPVTEGSARLARALSNVKDCLSVPSLSPDDLESGEFGFHLAGAKSYGRSRTFLLQNGYSQIESMLDRLGRSDVN
jgi:thioredoxin reductase